MSFMSRLKHSWDAFRTNRDPTAANIGVGDYFKPDRLRLTRGNERTIITSIYNRIALDACSFTIKHARIDENDKYLGDVNSKLNYCFTTSANIDQIPRAFMQDLIMSMFDEGCVAVVPVETTTNPEVSGSYDVETIRVGKIIEWYPKHVKLEVYNQEIGRKAEIIMPKDVVCIIENPFYAIMNEPNSTAKRLNRKLTLLDYVDEQAGSGKLEMLIKLPYTIKSPARQKQADLRRKAIEQQLTEGNKYGIAYIDGTENVTQLNRSLENNLLNQISELIEMLYSQLGITKEIMNGTADEKVMKNYYSRIIEPILSAITDEMKRKFLTKTARTQGQSIIFYNNPFKLVAATDVAEMADKLTRNEIMSTNEFRQVIGLMPVMDEKADELRNKNLNPGEGQTFASTTEVGGENPEGTNNAVQYGNNTVDISRYINKLSKQGGTE